MGGHGNDTLAAKARLLERFLDPQAHLRLTCEQVTENMSRGEEILQLANLVDLRLVSIEKVHLIERNEQ